MLENTQKITVIEADKRITLYCPIGEDYYTADILIKFMPKNFYMDYIVLDKFLDGLSGENLTIEDAADKIYKELQKYKPNKTKITIEAFSNTHLHVKVTKGDDI